MHELDESFKRKKDAAAHLKKMRRQRMRLSFAAGLLLIILSGSIGFWILSRPDFKPAPTADQADQTSMEVPAYAPTILDLAGDPLRIELGAGGLQSQTTREDVPADMSGFGLSGKVSILHEKILPSSQRLVTAIPSTPQDFAFFQAQRNTVAQADPSSLAKNVSVTAGQGSAAQSAPEVSPAAAKADGVPGDAGGGWADIGSADLDGSDKDFKKTAIENNITTIALISEHARSASTEDDFRRVISESPPTVFLVSNGLTNDEAGKVADQLKAQAGIEKLPAGSLVAMRFLKDAKSVPVTQKLVQIAVYEPEKFLGALAVDESGNIVTAADPWVSQNLFRKLDAPTENLEQKRYRLLDGIYSVGLRNAVPSSIIGEAIMHLSRGHDLGEFATEDDSFTLIYSDDGRVDGNSQSKVIYAGIDGKNSSIHCFIFKPADANDFSCLDEHDKSNTIEVTNGMVTPVAGVITSSFGPRQHPILHTVLMHEGVDWAAPVGTPVKAAYPGTISTAGDNGSYGNFIKIDHAGGRSTGYAHLSGFAQGITVGKVVKAGDVIGYVGTTGRSTGPHLHFELYVGGKPVDPLQTAIASSDSGGEAVETMVDQIVRVESGGDSNAKNPLSTAVGLGQFIESTWMRMMQTYRPDLARSLDRTQILALRLDPTLSREMVANLARENKSYLEAGGQTITAGRLYLAHFLGPEGARTVLAASDGDQLDKVLGSSVIQANPFLTGKDVAYVKNWAEHKMNHKAGDALPETVTRKSEEASPEFIRFRTAVLAML